MGMQCLSHLKRMKIDGGGWQKKFIML